MAEPRRVELMPATGNDRPQEKEKGTLSVRFSLPLSESTEKNCPEFSYVELLKNALDEEEDDFDPDDPFSASDRAEERKLLNLAKSLEQKYATKPPPGSMGKKKKKKRRDRAEDMVDLGDGYDETDPFVDNSEAYDELVPACMTTRHGGFYINSGRLDFKYYSDMDSDDDFAGPRKKKKKLRIASDSDGEIVVVRKRGRPKKKRLEGEMDRKDLLKKKRKKFSSGDNGERSPKKKKFDKEKYKTKKPYIDISGEAAVTTTNSTSHQNGLVSSPGPKPNSSSYLDAFASDNPYDSGSSSQSKPASSLMKPDVGNSEAAASSAHQQVDSSEEGQSQSPRPETAPDLPDNLPASLLNTIAKIKQAAKQSTEGKCKFFSGSVNDMLLEIEMHCRKMSTRTRLIIFSHLSSFLPCGKETLLKRAKKLRLNQQDDKLKDPMDKLKEAINRAMGPMLERYQAECAAAAQARQDRSQDDRGKPEGGSSDSEEEGGEKGEKKKRIMGPRKKFQWTSEIRSLVCDIVRIKMEMYEVSKVRAQTPEEYLRAFLDAEIKPMWPQGWIQTRMIFKESRAVHAKWTVALPKPKKIMYIAKTAGGLVGTMSAGNTPALSGTNLPGDIRPPEKPLPRSLGASPIFMGNTTAKKFSQDDSAANRGSGVTLLDLAEEKSYPSYVESKQLSKASPVVAGADSSSTATTGPKTTHSSVKAPGSSLLASHLTGDSHYVSLGMAATEALKSFSALATQDKAAPLALTNKKSPSKEKAVVPTKDFIGNFQQFLSSGAASSQASSKSVEISDNSVKSSAHLDRKQSVDSTESKPVTSVLPPSSSAASSQSTNVQRPASFPASLEGSRHAAVTSTVSRESKVASTKSNFAKPNVPAAYEGADVSSLISFITSSIQSSNPSLIKPQSSVSSTAHVGAKSGNSSSIKPQGLSVAGKVASTYSSVSSSSDIRKSSSNEGQTNKPVATNRTAATSASSVHRSGIVGSKSASQSISAGSGVSWSHSSHGTSLVVSRPNNQNTAVSASRMVTSVSTRPTSTSPSSGVHYKTQQAADSTKQPVHSLTSPTQRSASHTQANNQSNQAKVMSKSLLSTSVSSSSGQTSKAPIVQYQQGFAKKDSPGGNRGSGQSVSPQSVHSSKSTTQTMHTSKSSHITHSPKSLQQQQQQHQHKPQLQHQQHKQQPQHKQQVQHQHKQQQSQHHQHKQQQSLLTPKSAASQVKKPSPTQQVSPQATFGGLTMSQLHAQTLDASQKFRHQSSRATADVVTSQTPTSSTLWRTPDQALSAYQQQQQQQQQQRHRLSSESESCLFSQPAAAATATRSYPSLHLSEQQSPPSIPPMALASMPRTPEHRLSGTNLFSHTSPQASSHLGMRSSLDGHSPQSLYSTMLPSPTHSLPQSPHGYGHPFPEHSSSQHRY